MSIFPHPTQNTDFSDLFGRQFRKLFSDAQILLRDIVGDAAQKVAQRVNPSEEQLTQIDRPAQDNVWHDAPDFSKGNLKQQLRQNIAYNKPLHSADLKDAAGTATQAAVPEDTRSSHDDIIQEQRYGTDGGVDPRSGLQVGATHLRDRARENIPEEHQNRAKRLGHSTRDYLSDKFHAEIGRAHV